MKPIDSVGGAGRWVRGEDDVLGARYVERSPDGEPVCLFLVSLVM